MIDCAATKTKVLGFYALHPRAKLPMKQTQGAACFDIHACCDDQIKGIGLSVSQGIIDSDYVEEVFVPMVNNTNKLFHIRSGERIAQIELVKTIPTINTWIEERPAQKTNRNGGFGSTGVE
jgi:dUTPase